MSSSKSRPEYLEISANLVLRAFYKKMFTNELNQILEIISKPRQRVRHQTKNGREGEWPCT